MLRFASIALLCLALTARAADMPDDYKDCGLAVVREVSKEVITPGTERTLSSIVGIACQPTGREVGEGVTLVQESPTTLTVGGAVDHTRVYARWVKWKGDTLTFVGPMVAVEARLPTQKRAVAIYEAAAYNGDLAALQRIRREEGPAKEIEKIAAAARSSKSPSAIMILEILRLEIEPGLGDRERWQLGTAMLAIATHADSPPDVAIDALARIERFDWIKDEEARKKWEITAAGALLDAFHAYAREGDPRVGLPLLSCLEAHVKRGWVKSAPVLKIALAGFAADAAAVQKRLADAGKAMEAGAVAAVGERILKSLEK